MSLLLLTKSGIFLFLFFGRATFHLCAEQKKKRMTTEILQGDPVVQENVSPDKTSLIGPGYLKGIYVDGKLWRKSLDFTQTCVLNFDQGWIKVNGKLVLDCPEKAIYIEKMQSMHCSNEFFEPFEVAMAHRKVSYPNKNKSGQKTNKITKSKPKSKRK